MNLSMSGGTPLAERLGVVVWPLASSPNPLPEQPRVVRAVVHITVPENIYPFIANASAHEGKFDDLCCDGD